MGFQYIWHNSFSAPSAPTADETTRLHLVCGKEPFTELIASDIKSTSSGTKRPCKELTAR